jgi:hypothetical protein
VADNIVGVLPVSIIIQKILFQVVVVHEIVVHWGLRVLQHVESDVIWIIIVCLKVIKFHLGILQPFVSILKHFVI